MVFKRIENCAYAVDLGKGEFKFSLVGVDGKDIADGNKKLTLALIWQLMRCHLLGFLASIRSHGGASGGALSDDQMIKWANEQVARSNPGLTMRDCNDKSLSSGLFLIELLANVEPRAVDRTHVTPGG